MRPKEIISLGIPKGEPLELTIKTIKKIKPRKGQIRKILYKIGDNPDYFSNDKNWGDVAKSIVKIRNAKSSYVQREIGAPFKIWGAVDIDNEAIEQLIQACKLPVSIKGALMPDAHVGYGLPIGGVLAVDNAVIPFAVGQDIACRMRLSVFSDPIKNLNIKREKLKEAIEKETRFGVGAKFTDTPRTHNVMDRDWEFCKIIKQVKNIAWNQLGSSGGGNHFCEFGVFSYTDKPDEEYLSLLTHSGSRGAGSQIATYFSNLAKEKHPELPKELLNLAWLGLDTQEGQEYWKSMNLMGYYAQANHELIHDNIIKRLNYNIIDQVENHHNFAWKENHDGKNVIVHRKGATPAGNNVRGVVPGSMGTPGYVISGKGNVESLKSCSHGAGRRMSRKKAKEMFKWDLVKKFLDKNNVTLISGGLDECPQVYKNIDEVMDHQKDLIRITGKFVPRLVKMA